MKLIKEKADEKLTIFVAESHNFIHFVRIVHHVSDKVLDVDANVRPLLDLETSGLVRTQQVTHLLIVDLKVRHTNKEPSNVTADH